jgi:hypothetical protein
VILGGLIISEEELGGLFWISCSFDDLLAGCASFCVVCCVDEIDQACWHVL